MPTPIDHVKEIEDAHDAGWLKGFCVGVVVALPSAFVLHLLICRLWQ